jgi:small subunit ribosomal protein S2
MSDVKNTEKIDSTTKKLFELGAHLGHKKNRLHPKSRKYIYKIVNGVSVIDLTQSVEQLDKAKKVLAQAGQEGKVILVVASKKVASQIAAQICKDNNVASITSKWLPGLLTNFDTIIKNVRKLRQMREDKESGVWDKYVKHERMKLDKEMVRLSKFYEGLLTIDKKPDLLLIVDVKKEKNALKEAQLYNMPVVAITDTNANPDSATYPVVVNDDAAEVIEYVLKDLIGAYAKARK